MLTTPRRSISYPNPDRSDRPDIPLHIYNVAIAADGSVLYAQGTAAARGSAAHQTSGGKFWWETDTSLLWYDDGTTWQSVGINPAGNIILSGPTSRLSFTAENASTNLVLSSMVSGDTFIRYGVTAAGSLTWGSGSGAQDLTLFRIAANILSIGFSTQRGALRTYASINGDIQYSIFKTTDTQPTFTVNGLGTIGWGPGGSTAQDTDLYRGGVGIVETTGILRTNTGGFVAANGSAARTVFYTFATGDTFNRFAIGGDGSMNFGTGSATADAFITRPAVGVISVLHYLLLGSDNTGSKGIRFYDPASDGYGAINRVAASGSMQIIAQQHLILAPVGTSGKIYITDNTAGTAGTLDTVLYRSTTATLKTDGSFDLAGNLLLGAALVKRLAALATNITVASSVTGDTVDRFTLQADGKHSWGPGGSTALDTVLYRAGAGFLRTDTTYQAVGSFQSINKAGTGSTAYDSYVTGDTQPRYLVKADGQLSWGPGGATAVDTAMSRAAAGVLTTTSLAQTGNYGTAFPASPVDGQEYTLVDSTSNPSYIWRFRYNNGSSSAYKWEFVGGSYLEGTTTLTIPRAGDYYVEIGAQGNNFGNLNQTILSLTAGGITLSAQAGGGGGSSQTIYGSAYDKGKMTALTASQTLTPTSSGNSTTRQFIRAQPVRCS